MRLPNQRAIFFHNQRTGGTSVQEALKQFSTDQIDVHVSAKGFAGSYKVVAGKKGNYKHWSIDKIVANGIISEDELNSWTTFTIIRNPWARALSLFFWETKNHFNEQGFKNWIAKIKPDDQLDFCCFNGRLVVDHIMRTETLGEDFNELLRILNVGAPLKQLNASKIKSSKAWKSYYNEETYNLVRAKYPRFLQLFPEYDVPFSCI